MYFNFDDSRPETPTMPSPLSRREGALLSIIVHLVVVIVILVGPELPFMKALEAKRQQELEEIRQRELERMRENARFVFVQPKVDIPALKPPPRAELSDIDRRARTIERAPDPKNNLAFSRGNSPERIVADAPLDPRRKEVPPPEPAAAASATSAATRPLQLPDDDQGDPRTNEQRRELQSRGPAVGAIANAIRNVQKYTQQEGLSNPHGGADQEFSESIQFDTKGVDFGSWRRRFIAQVRRNWLPLIPPAAMSLRGRVVVTFNVHRDGRVTDITVAQPSSVEGFTHAAYYGIATSNPTYPLPPEYPDDKLFITAIFYYNEAPWAP